MRITAVELIQAHLPFHEPFRIAIAESAATTNVFVRVTTETGLVGTGEASPSPAITGDTTQSMLEAGRALAGAVLGRDLFDLEGMSHWMEDRVDGQPTIRSGFDMAFHDLAARAVGIPLYQLLGGPRREFETDNTVGMDEPEVMASKAASFVEEGFRAVKAKVGSGFDEDVARILRIRQAIGPAVPIRLDANQGWDVSTAVRVLDAVSSAGIEYCEQPVRRGHTKGLKEVRERAEVPIMADESVFDEHDALELVCAGACDYLNIKLSKSAGIRTALRISGVAQAAGASCMVGCMSETRLGLTAAAHLVSARTVIRFADLDSHVDHTVDPVTGGLVIENGTVILPDGPGIGAGLDPAFVASCPIERFEA